MNGRLGMHGCCGRFSCGKRWRDKTGGVLDSVISLAAIQTVAGKGCEPTWRCEEMVYETGVIVAGSEIRCDGGECGVCE